MKRNIISYIAAFIAAGAHALSVFYTSLFGPEIVNGGIVMSRYSYGFLYASVFFLIAEYIFFGRKDNGAKIALRFIIHNVFSAAWAFGIYGVYNAANLREKYYWSSEIILSIIAPGTIRGSLIFTTFSMVICIVIFVVRTVIKRKKANS